MMLYIYLGISILTLIVFLLTSASLIHTAKGKIKDLPKKLDKDKAGLVNAYLKLVIISFIPLVNVFFLLVMLFGSNEINKRANKMIDDANEKLKS
ncbi:MAG TPA: hypothetical protein GX708_24980 [Gallicola sp.]|nr:hypothetical protein [Gallicola sp.]